MVSGPIPKILIKTDILMTAKLLRRILLSCLPLILLFTCSSYPKLSRTDNEYIQRFAKDWNLAVSAESVHNNCESEFAFISKVQDSVVTNIAHEQIPSKYFGSVAYYYNNRKGFCYVRAVLMEKIFYYYGFHFRHAFIYFGNNRQQARTWDFFKRDLPSHALFEIKTKNGWMVVGTNENWLGIDQKNEVMDLSVLRSRLQKNELIFAK